MANIKSAIKRIRTSKRNRERNLEYRSRLKKAIKAAQKSKNPEDIRSAISALDKAALKGIIHRNLASRKKSSLTKLSAPVK